MGVKGRPTLNPYRTAASLLVRRIGWDLTPESFRSRTKLRRLRNSHAGERAVILCNGPSLLKVDFESLRNVYVFGLNKINLLFDKTDFRPNAIVAVNELVIEQNAEFFRSTEIPTFLDAFAYREIGNAPSATYLKSANLVRFAEDVSVSVYQGHTVTYVAMQLAFHMGFSAVTLVGCDHNFAAKGPANATVRAGEKDESHFDPRYFSGVNWQLPDLIQSEISYLLALDAFQMDGRVLSNSTEGGKLELLPRIPLAKFLSGGAS